MLLKIEGSSWAYTITGRVTVLLGLSSLEHSSGVCKVQAAMAAGQDTWHVKELSILKRSKIPGDVEYFCYLSWLKNDISTKEGKVWKVAEKSYKTYSQTIFQWK